MGAEVVLLIRVDVGKQGAAVDKLVTDDLHSSPVEEQGTRISFLQINLWLCSSLEPQVPVWGSSTTTMLPEATNFSRFLKNITQRTDLKVNSNSLSMHFLVICLRDSIMVNNLTLLVVSPSKE